MEQRKLVFQDIEHGTLDGFVVHDSIPVVQLHPGVKDTGHIILGKGIRWAGSRSVEDADMSAYYSPTSLALKLKLPAGSKKVINLESRFSPADVTKIHSALKEKKLV
jgi:hypothetical protein